MRERLLKYCPQKLRDKPTLCRVVIALLGIAAVVACATIVAVCVAGYLADIEVWTFPPPIKVLLTSLYANVGVEVVSVLFTVLVIDELYRRRARQDEKRRLILQMGSPNHEFAIEAVRILGLEGWLKDGSLKGANLGRANLREAELPQVDLQRAILIEANLQGANLFVANLQEAFLDTANLEEATMQVSRMQDVRLVDANLQRASLEGSNLQGANLWNADLRGANLRNTHLQEVDMLNARLAGAKLENARLDEKTLLPDGNNWTPDTDMRRFTDPEHPNFYQPPPRLQDLGLPF